MSVEEIVLQLSKTEKLKLMESLWIDLSRESQGIESPTWHEAELKRTASNIATGEEQLLDWEKAKKEIRGI